MSTTGSIPGPPSPGSASGGKRKMRRGSSLPTLRRSSASRSGGAAATATLGFVPGGDGGPGGTPYAQPQRLCTVSVGRRFLQMEAVGGGQPLHVVSKRPLPFVVEERGLESEQKHTIARLPPHTIARLPPDPLPPMHEILRATEETLNFKEALQEVRRNREAKLNATAKSSAGFVRRGEVSPAASCRSLCGPAFGGQQRICDARRLPMRRPQADLLVAKLQRLGTPSKIAMQDADVAFASDARRLSVGSQDGTEGTQPPGSANTAGGRRSSIGSAGRRRSSAEMRPASAMAFPPPAQAESRPGPELEPLFWDEEELRQVFLKFDTDQDGEVQTEELDRVLHYLGARPQEGEAQSLVESQTHFATLDWQEFLDFLRSFWDIDAQRLHAEFEAYDDDNSGFLEFNELHAILQKQGFSPTAETTLEAMEAAGKEKTQSVSFREFQGLREHLRVTEGFSKADVDEYRDLYERVNLADCRGLENVSTEIWRITMYLGYSVSRDNIESYVEDLDGDGNVHLLFTESLKVLRRVRDVEREDSSNVVMSLGNGEHLMVEDLGIALGRLGYFVSEEAIWEILDQQRDFESEEYLTVEELNAFLRSYRRCEGFTGSEMSELEEVFKSHLHTGEGLHTLELGPVLRWFGFTHTLQQVQRLVEEIDFDASGIIEINEFVKLMRRLHQAEASKRHQTFDRLDTNGRGRVPADLLPRAVLWLYGADADPNMIREALRASQAPDGDISNNTCTTAIMPTAPRQSVEVGPAGVGEDARGTGGDEKGKDAAACFGSTDRNATKDPMQGASALNDAGDIMLNRRSFEAFFIHYRRLACEEIRANSGYSRAEVMQLREAFDFYDADHSGTVERQELSKMVVEYFPDATKTKQGQLVVLKAIEEVGSDPNGELKFGEFLMLMRKCDDRRDAADMLAEQAIVQESGLVLEEVDGFRQIFSAHVNWRGELDLSTITNLLSRVVDLNEDQLDDLSRIVKEVHPHGREVARFPQFMRLVRRLTQDNVCGLNAAATRMVRRQTSKKSVCARA